MTKWYRLCAVGEIPVLGSRVVAREEGNLAVFRAADGTVFALRDLCPHEGGPLAQGIVHGHRVTCPLHGWNIELASGAACEPDVGCTRAYPVRVEEGVVWLEL